VFDEVSWLAGQGVREVYLVSENTTSYGKDLGDLRALESLVPRLAAVSGITRVRLSYLQPAELRPGLIDVLTGVDGVASYFDLSFQHASGAVLRRMRRFGDGERFGELIAAIRARDPQAGLRTNVLVGFPGETERDMTQLEQFLGEADLDAVGVFGYSDEEGTEAAGMPGKLPEQLIAERVERVADLVGQLVADRAARRVGQRVRVLVERVWPGGGRGRAEHQGPEGDGYTTLRGTGARVGQLVDARVIAADGVDLLAEVTG
jgi:MiaB/RimO family radical SAM methylthiotransferase